MYAIIVVIRCLPVAMFKYAADLSWCTHVHIIDWSKSSLLDSF